MYTLKTKHDQTYDDGTLRTKHVTTNTILEFDDSGHRATARSYFTVLQATPDLPLQPVIAGRYHDAFEKVDGAWRFHERVIHGDLIGDLTNHLRDNPLDTAQVGGRHARSCIDPVRRRVRASPPSTRRSSTAGTTRSTGPTRSRTARSTRCGATAPWAPATARRTT